MKKKLKKLALSRETLRNLDTSRLRRVAGATGLDECTGQCMVTQNTCGTCQGTICDTCFTRLAQCTEACNTDRTC